MEVKFYFTKEQQEEIRLVMLMKKADTKEIVKLMQALSYEGANEDILKEIRLGAENNLSVEEIKIFARIEFRREQMEEIRLGLKAGLDVQYYTNPKLNKHHMEEIRSGLEAGLDVSRYANPNFDFEKVLRIKMKLEREAKEKKKDEFLKELEEFQKA